MGFWNVCYVERNDGCLQLIRRLVDPDDHCGGTESPLPQVCPGMTETVGVVHTEVVQVECEQQIMKAVEPSELVGM